MTDEPTFSSHPRHDSPRDPRDGASLDEAEAVVGMLQDLGKSPTGVVTQLIMAVAVVLVDSHDTDAAADSKVGYLPELLRACMDSVRHHRAAEAAEPPEADLPPGVPTEDQVEDAVAGIIGHLKKLGRKLGSKPRGHADAVAIAFAGWQVEELRAALRLVRSASKEEPVKALAERTLRAIPPVSAKRPGGVRYDA